MVTGTRHTQSRHHAAKANYVTSSPLVLAYALAGNVLVNLEEFVFDVNSNKIAIRDIWPQRHEIEKIEDEIISKKIQRHIDDNINVGFYFLLKVTSMNM
jgi:aconitate hydratase